jgi:hypothetical protein
LRGTWSGKPLKKISWKTSRWALHHIFGKIF